MFIKSCRYLPDSSPARLSRWPARLLAGSIAATPPGQKQRGGIGTAACLVVITTLGRRRDLDSLDFFLLTKTGAQSGSCSEKGGLAT